MYNRSVAMFVLVHAGLIPNAVSYIIVHSVLVCMVTKGIHSLAVLQFHHLQLNLSEKKFVILAYQARVDPMPNALKRMEQVLVFASLNISEIHTLAVVRNALSTATVHPWKRPVLETNVSIHVFRRLVAIKLSAWWSIMYQLVTAYHHIQEIHSALALLFVSFQCTQ